jgi:hypothetical protein
MVTGRIQTTWQPVLRVADPDPTFSHPGSQIGTVSIPDPGSESKNLSILNPKKQKKVSKLEKI